jgi:uncharacterized protein YjbK
MKNKKGSEKELKLVLSESEYNLLISHLKENAKAGQVLKQRNTYFDTRDMDLLRRGDMLRLRDENGSRILTLKQRASCDDGYFVCNEKEEKLKDGADWKSICVQWGVTAELKSVGAIENLRQCYHWRSYLLEIDRTIFPGGKVDHELECETLEPEQLKRVLKELFANLQIPYSPQDKTKFRRFLEAVGLCQNGQKIL